MTKRGSTDQDPSRKLRRVIVGEGVWSTHDTYFSIFRNKQTGLWHFTRLTRVGGVVTYVSKLREAQMLLYKAGIRDSTNRCYARFMTHINTRPLLPVGK